MVEPHLQKLELVHAHLLGREQALDRRLDAVRLLAKAHGAGQARAALEGVQAAHTAIGSRAIGRRAHPARHVLLQLRQQFVGLFLEDGQQFGIEGVDSIDVAFDVELVLNCWLRHGHARALAFARALSRAHAGTRWRCDERPTLMVDQALHQRRQHRLEEAGSKLMQQPADLVSRVVEQLGLASAAATDRLRAQQRMLERARQSGEIAVAHRGRIARQRVRQGHGRLRHRAGLVLDGPLSQFGDEAARLLVGLVEEDVEERDADAQRPDDLHRLFVSLVFSAAGVIRLGRAGECLCSQEVQRRGDRRIVVDHGLVARRATARRRHIQDQGRLIVILRKLVQRGQLQRRGVQGRLGRRLGCW